MEAKTNINKRIICLLIIVSLIGSIFIGYISNAAGDDEVTYKVEQVTKSEEINSSNLYQYILVANVEVVNRNVDSGGTDVALVDIKSSSGSNHMSTENFIPVTIENGNLTVSADANILWELTKSKVSVLEEGDSPAIKTPLSSTSGRSFLKLSSRGNGGTTGIRYSQDGNSFNFEETGNGTFIISENNCETSNKYIGFSDYFGKNSEDKAVEFKVFKVIKKYNYKSSKFLSSEETAAVEDVKIAKSVSQYENYDDTAIAEVKLSTQGTEYDKTCDVILILDDSTTVYTIAPENSEKTRAQIIREDALLFAEELLEINPENRINVIKFGREITNEDVSNDIGFSNDIDDIEEMIGGDKAYTSPGTNYSLAFEKANEIMEEYSDPNHGKVVIFLSDGMPSVYNGISFTAFSNTSDAEGVATNWINYVTNTPLQEAELMKATGTTIYTIGSIEEDTSMNNSEGYIIPAGTTKEILENVANGKTNFYDFDKIDTQLEKIFDEIAKDFNYYPTNASVKDHLTADIELLTKTVGGYIPQIVFKRGDVEVEKITFNEEGTEAYTSLNPGVNIMDSGKFEGGYVSFDGDTISWTIGDLYKYEYTLEFPIYLNNTVDLYGDGTDRPTGEYSVSETSTLIYTDVTNNEVTKEFEPAELPWKNPTDESSMTDEVEPEEAKPEPQTATNVSTGDNTIRIVGIVMFIAFGLALYKRKLLKAKKYNKNIIY